MRLIFLIVFAVFVTTVYGRPRPPEVYVYRPFSMYHENSVTYERINIPDQYKGINHANPSQTGIRYTGYGHRPYRYAYDRKFLMRDYYKRLRSWKTLKRQLEESARSQGLPGSRKVEY